MSDQGRRKPGVLVGVSLAGSLLPGITLGAETPDVILSVLAATLVMAVLTQLIHIGPSGRVPLAPLAAFGLAGFVQDALIWWLLSWLGPKIGHLRIEGLDTILLAALITRATVLLLSQLAPPTTTETTED
ncbi:hypothetical protein ABZY16_13835 [Streptomyces sp. NPDC006553]|uniref:hypothetical protein n=1 Tax=Streptomyces sp. NPDC006553 TaxID=3157180 RepID=UPI0033B00CA7